MQTVVGCALELEAIGTGVGAECVLWINTSARVGVYSIING